MTDDAPWTVGRLLAWTTDFLRGKGAESPRLDAEVLLAAARGCQRIELYTTFDEVPSEGVRTKFKELVRRRAEGAPVAYLVGHREFFSLSFDVTPDVLIPRPETELLVVRAIDLSRSLASSQDTLRFADVGTGSGILAVCCAKHLPECRVTALDISPAALAVAATNAAKHGVAKRIEFVESDLFANCPPDARFDLVLCNPPYVATDELAELDPGVRNHEPRLALDGGVEGIEVIQRLIPQAVERLRPGGWLLLEVSPLNATRVETLVESTAGLTRQATINDLAQHPRVVQGQRSSC
jgi:release factor glutamine methyltransferase